MKRRALLLGALLMPTTAHAQDKASRPSRRRRSRARQPRQAVGAAAAQGGARPSSSPSTPRPSPIAASFPTPGSPSSTRGRQAARPYEPARRRLLGGHDLQRPPLAALPAARLRSATAVADRALPARPGRHARARRDGAPGRAAPDRRVGQERRLVAPQLASTPAIRAPAISGSPATSPPTSTRRPSG